MKMRGNKNNNYLVFFTCKCQCDFDSSPQFTDKGNSWCDRQASYTLCRNSLSANHKTYSTFINTHTGKAIG